MHVRFQILVTLSTKVYFCGLSCKTRPRAAPVRGIPQGRPSAYARNGDFAVTGRDRPLSRMSAFTNGERRPGTRPTWQSVRWQMRTGPWEPTLSQGPCDFALSLSASDPRKRYRGGFQALGEQRPKT